MDPSACNASDAQRAVEAREQRRQERIDAYRRADATARELVARHAPRLVRARNVGRGVAAVGFPTAAVCFWLVVTARTGATHSGGADLSGWLAVVAVVTSVACGLGALLYALIRQECYGDVERYVARLVSGGCDRQELVEVLARNDGDHDRLIAVLDELYAQMLRPATTI